MILELFKSALGRLRVVAFLEGCSFLALGFTMFLKYQFALLLPNYIVGMLHGLLFILYIFLVLQVAYIKKWNIITIFWAGVASLIPFGTFYADKKIFSISYKSN